MFMGNDGYTMQYTMTMYFKKFWNNALSGNFVHMDMTIGEGLSPMLTMAYYGLTDPVNTIFFAATKENVLVLYAFNMFIRWFATGACAGIYLSTKSSNKKIIATGALIYAFSGYMLVWQFCPAVLATGYLFPLLLLTIDKALKEKKYVGFVLVTTLAYLTNYYTAILMSVALCFYALFWIIRNIRQTKVLTKERVITCLHTICAHATGLALVAWMLIPMIVYFTSGTRTDNYATFSWWHYELKYYLDALINMFTPCAGASAFFSQTPKLIISCSPLLIPVFLLALQHAKRNIMTIGTSIAVVLLITVPLFAEITSLTGYPVHRWTFLASLLFALCYVKHAEKVQQLTIVQKIIACAIVILSAIGNFWNAPTAAAIINCVISCIVGIVIIKPSVKVFYRATCIICVLLSLGWLVGAEEIMHYLSRRIWSDPQYNLITINDQYLADDINNRVAWIGHAGNVNTGVTTNTYTNHVSWNSLPYGANYYNQYTQQYPTISSSYWPINHNGRLSTHLLGATKYFITDGNTTVPYNYELLHSGDRYKVWAAKHHTSVGYGFIQTMSLTQFNSLNIAQKQVALMNYAVIDENCEEIAIQSYKINATKNGNSYTVNLPEHTELYMVCTAESTENVYDILLHHPQWWQTYTQGLNHQDQVIAITASNETGGITRNITARHPNAYPSYYAPERTVCFGSALSGQVTITLEYSDIIDIQDVQFFALPLGEYDDAITKLTPNMVDMSESNGILTGTIDAAQDMAIQIAVPYQKGWHAYIDGNEVDTFAVGVQYTGFNISEGKHNIELKYEEPGFTAGAICTAIGALVLSANVGVWIYKRRKKVSIKEAL